MFPQPRPLHFAFILCLVATLAACATPDPEGTNNQDDPNQQTNQNHQDIDPPGDTLQSELGRELSPAVDPSTRDQFAADNRDFAFALFDQLREDEDDDANIFVSPHSISIALAMTYAGAAGDTRTQIANTMRFRLDDDELHPAFNKLDLELATRSQAEVDDGDAFELDIVNATWGQQNYPFLDGYLDTLAVNYGAGLNIVDFVSDFEAVRAEINQWVEDQTNDRIKDLLPPGSLNALTRLVLTNAIYFYGSWHSSFDEDATTDEPFALLDGSTVDVPLMRHNQLQAFDFFEDENTVAASIPYVGNAVSMIAFMPADPDADFAAWEADLDRDVFDTAAYGLSHGEGRVYLPRFESEGDFSLRKAFEAMGMSAPFEQGVADFTNMHPEDAQSLRIKEIFHKTFVSVDEEGTEAAAATAAVIGTDSAPIEPIEVRFDRPFYYAVYDHPTETILFLGRMVDPS